MKVLLVVLTIRFLFSLLDNVAKEEVLETGVNGVTRHPAEYELR